MINEQEAGLPSFELSRKHRLSPAIFYKVKRQLADAMLDTVVLEDLLGRPDDTVETAGRSAAGDAGSPDLLRLGLCPHQCRFEDGVA